MAKLETAHSSPVLCIGVLMGRLFVREGGKKCAISSWIVVGDVTV